MNRKQLQLVIAGLTALLTAVGCAATTAGDAPEADLGSPVAAETEATLSTNELDGPELVPVFFDTDRAVLRPDARATLASHADAIRLHPEWGVVTIEGHCDERGSDEYNLDLGRRRAAAVAAYLGELGVEPSRLETQSYGEARPASTAHDEVAWRQNRRAQLVSETVHAAQR